MRFTVEEILIRYVFLFFSFLSIGLFAQAEIITLSEEFLLERASPAIFSFHVKDAEKRQIRVCMDVRINWPTLGGYTTALNVSINGQKIKGKYLLNKPLKCRLRNGGILNWNTEEGAGSYVVMYAGRFSDEIKTNEKYIYGIIDEEQDPFRFVFDLSSMTVHNQENILRIQSGHNAGLKIANLQIEFDANPLPRINDSSALVRPAPAGILPDYTWKTREYLRPNIELADGQGLIFDFMGKKHPLASRYSLANSRWQNAGQKADVHIQGKHTLKDSIDCEDYLVERHFEVHPAYVKVREKFINRSDKVIGIMFEHGLSLPEKCKQILRAGRETELEFCSSSSNPSMVALLKEYCVGIVCEDDILRNQHYLKRTDKELILGDRQLGLAPGAEHELEWSIYFLKSGGYYDFVNAVRQNWGSNFTWRGPLAFPRSQKVIDWNVKNVTPEFVRQYLDNNPVRLVMTHLATSPSISRAKSTLEKPWIGHGTAIPYFDWWCERTEALVRVMKEVDPDVQVYAYMHKNLCSEPGYAEKYADSVALDKAGRIRTTGQLGFFQPTLNNSYGKALKKVYEYIVEELGAHIYMDEICLSVTSTAAYPEWDGCTAQINPINHRMQGKLSVPNLLIRPWLEEMIAYLKTHNKKLLANGSPATRTLQKHNFQHFIEAGAGETSLIGAHLCTPLAWQGYEVGLPGYRHFHNSLKHGALAITWSGKWNDFLFPFTPVELASGYLIGEERVVTSVSGIFGWNDDSQAELKVYDGQGDLLDGFKLVKHDKSGIKSFEIRMPSDHTAVLIRKKSQEH